MRILLITPPLVQGDEYIMTLTRYIHLNPAKVKAAGDPVGLPVERVDAAGDRNKVRGNQFPSRECDEKKGQAPFA